MNSPRKKKPGRKPFVIDEKNKFDVYDYLVKKVAREGSAHEHTYEITHFKAPEHITEWCRKNMMQNEWNAMVRAIQKRKERSKKRKQTKKVDLHRVAHDAISEWARRYNVTLSHAVLIMDKLSYQSSINRLSQREVEELKEYMA